MEEERRLAYVAYTRAKDRLYITESEGYSNNNTFRFPSRFIFNTRKDSLDYIVELGGDIIDGALAYITITKKSCKIL